MEEEKEEEEQEERGDAEEVVGTKAQLSDGCYK